MNKFKDLDDVQLIALKEKCELVKQDMSKPLKGSNMEGLLLFLDNMLQDVPSLFDTSLKMFSGKSHPPKKRFIKNVAAITALDLARIEDFVETKKNNVGHTIVDLQVSTINNTGRYIQISFKWCNITTQITEARKEFMLINFEDFYA